MRGAILRRAPALVVDLCDLSRFDSGRAGSATPFAQVERRVADAIGVREQSLDAGQHSDLRRGGERMLGTALC